jgi:hypothetical protein
MTSLRRFPDVQRVIAAALVDGGLVADADHTGSETPTDLQDRLPFIRVWRIAGGSSGWLNDQASIDIDVFTDRYTTAELLAERVREFLVGPPAPAHQLDRVECLSGPRELPWDENGVVRRWGATYQVIARRCVVVEI